MENVTTVEKNKLSCHDCKKKISIKGEELIDAVTLLYQDGGEKVEIVKCNECFKKNPSLTNFRNCEVYSRVVGYIRPVQQWHKGKKQEYKERKEYNYNKA